MHVQLFLSLLSLPVLVAWGLPFSLMTVVGNLFFTPFLTIFLLLSTCVFFTELVAIPNQWCIYLLEKLCALWMYLLEYGSTSWLYGIDQWGLIVCTAGALCACVLLYHKWWGREKNSWKPFFLLLLLPFGYQKIRSFFPYKTTITCIKKSAHLTCRGGEVSIEDYGAFGEKKSAGTWIQYTFLAEVLKQCGSTRFATITCHRANTHTLEALAMLCRHAQVKKIVVVHPRRRTQDYRTWWKGLKETAHKQNTLLTEYKD